MARVILIDIPLPKARKFGKVMSMFGSRMPALNIILLGTILREKGHRVELILDDESYTDIAEKINSFDPHVVGITFMTMEYPYLKEVTQVIRNCKNNVPIICGGYHTSVYPEQVMEGNKDLSCVFIGEADQTFPQAIELFSNNDFCFDQLNDIPNIIFRKPDGSMCKTKESPAVIDMDKLPFFDYDLVPRFFDRFYPAFNRHFLPRPCATVVTTRGCPYNCVFCGRKITGAKIRSNSMEYRIELIKYFKKKFGIKSIIYADELLTFGKDDTVNFCERILDDNLEKIQWVCSSRVDTVDDELCKYLRRAGCRQVSFGIESGSQKILDLIQKKTSLEKTVKALQACRRNDLNVVATFMLGCFGETQETLRETYRFIMHNPIDFISLTNFTPMPGSRSYDMYKDYGTLATHDFREYNTFSGIVFIPFGLTKNDILWWRKKIYSNFYFRTKSLFSRLRYLTDIPTWKYISTFLTRC